MIPVLIFILLYMFIGFFIGVCERRARLTFLWLPEILRSLVIFYKENW